MTLTTVPIPGNTIDDLAPFTARFLHPASIGISPKVQTAAAHQLIAFGRHP